MSILNSLEPRNVLGFFEKLSSVPHGSGNTKEISDICVKFAEERNLRYYRDEAGNVIIYKDASAGVVSDNPVIIQGHLDMVCVKTQDCDKNLLIDPIDILTDGKYIWADKTSLGADDIIAVAIAMAILDDDTLVHPPICAVFTVDEETSMLGAKSLDKSKITGNRMINIDSEEESFITCGCAGAIRAGCSFDIRREYVCDDDIFYRINVDNLLGGHSGADIAYNRGNAIRLLARLIYGLSLKWNIRLCEFRGGQFDNAIPSAAEAVVAVPESSYKEFESLAMKHQKLFRFEYKESDPDVRVVLSRDFGCITQCVSHEQTKAVMRCISSVPDGLRKFNDTFRVPSVSSNIGLAELSQTSFRFTSLIRSNEPGQKEEIYEMIKAMIEHDGGRIRIENQYPEWRYREDSDMIRICKESYKELFNKDISVTITHGGVECAVFSDSLPEPDIISIGPDITDIHSPREKVSVESIGRVYRLTCDILRRLS
ncbi:MAG: beta-Ala-His dipeptidase [Lachnospiraceae bacterium]|nr:beta-Ala-His dipeptidase [Lachnospiraceae bacterium]